MFLYIVLFYTPQKPQKQELGFVHKYFTFQKLKRYTLTYTRLIYGSGRPAIGSCNWFMRLTFTETTDTQHFVFLKDQFCDTCIMKCWFHDLIFFGEKNWIPFFDLQSGGCIYSQNDNWVLLRHPKTLYKRLFKFSWNFGNLFFIHPKKCLTLMPR